MRLAADCRKGTLYSDPLKWNILLYRDKPDKGVASFSEAGYNGFLPISGYIDIKLL